MCLTIMHFEVVYSYFYYLNQTNHRITTNMQRRIYGHATDVEIRPLNEEKAVQAAVDLIGEAFIFSVLFLPASYFLRYFTFTVYSYNILVF